MGRVLLNTQLSIKLPLMKSLALVVLCLFTFNVLNAQQTFSVPEVTPEQEKEILYNHVIAYFAAGVTFAKAQGISTEDYGKYIGNEFKLFWNPDAGFVFFANQMMFILKGVNPYSEMKIIEQSHKMVRFKMSNMDMLFKQGSAYGLTYKEFLTASEGVISTLADYMKVSFEQKVTDDGWYLVSLKAK